MNIELLNQVTAFLWLEADLLDHNELDEWLDSWIKEGTYIIPIDTSQTDYVNTLNYAHDNDEMRRMRVARLESGHAISSTPRATTVRTVSRIRILDDSNDIVTVRCAQSLWEHRKESVRNYVADVEFQLKKEGDSFKIQRKVINLVNATNPLAGIGYIL